MGLKRRTEVKPEFSLAAMIDVIFLLLMFFMLTSKLVSPNALNLKLPSSNSTSVAASSLSVSIKKDGTLYLNSDRVNETRLISQLTGEIKRIGGDPKKTTITIVAEKGVPIEYVVNVMDVARQLGVGAILATEPKQ
ncbi:MAG: biopolymer transporter ExbD [Saprospiraceae bacterium]|nr:biopolymer transporter ExbD [Saprospiraceae bacterium]MBP7680169.1 biopolymer transporter ExbD [Saprospiraceae bacterium]